MTTLQRIETDVIVVGAAAGGAAALGRDVILLEKNPQLGGSTAWSVGSVTATCTPHQIKQGIKDHPAHHLDDYRRTRQDIFTARPRSPSWRRA